MVVMKHLTLHVCGSGWFYLSTITTHTNMAVIYPTLKVWNTHFDIPVEVPTHYSI